MKLKREAPGEFFRAALVRAGGVLEHLAEFAPDAATREQARDALSAPVRAELERMRVLERVAAAARVAVNLDVAGDDGVGMLLAALDELEGFGGVITTDRGNTR